ncbi:hypothetical protein R1flu_001105 [Riccia fluitans]|uniref:Cyclic nucleotide-binding domain-containing protein n=1 Tax=Riccia fluitans TaxID=41844 RepID=A0ABD1Y2R7_9MARC
MKQISSAHTILVVCETLRMSLVLRCGEAVTSTGEQLDRSYETELQARLVGFEEELNVLWMSFRPVFGLPYDSQELKCRQQCLVATVRRSLVQGVFDCWKFALETRHYETEGGHKQQIHRLEASVMLEMESAKSNGGPDAAVHPEQALVLLRALPLLQQLSEDSLPEIAVALKTVHYGPGEPIVHRNSEGERLYIIWRGEAKVVSPPREGAVGHTESTVRCGDYFGLVSPKCARQSYKADVFAVTEVICLQLAHDHSDLISDSSVWNWSERPALIERILQLEKIEPDLFRSKVPDMNFKRKVRNTFGGQTIGQALIAASRTVDPGYMQDSLHCYFLRTGKENDPVMYKVERTRDGMSFATRHVQAIQFGKIIFVMYASFKRPEDTPAFEHNEHPMPSAPSPEELIQDEVRYDNFLMDPRLPLAVKQRYAGVKLPLGPIELRHCDAMDRFQAVKTDARQRIWMRARDKLSDDTVMHGGVASYCSDITLLIVGLRLHPESRQTRMQVLSLDHSMWFHRPFKADEWFLYEVTGPWAGDGRGLSNGRIYQNGELVVTVTQEGLLRKLEDKVEKAAKL